MTINSIRKSISELFSANQCDSLLRIERRNSNPTRQPSDGWREAYFITSLLAPRIAVHFQRVEPRDNQQQSRVRTEWKPGKLARPLFGTSGKRAIVLARIFRVSGYESCVRSRQSQKASSVWALSTVPAPRLWTCFDLDEPVLARWQGEARRWAAEEERQSSETASFADKFHLRISALIERDETLRNTSIYKSVVQSGNGN